MVIIISLITAVLFGTGDFFGGMAAKRTAVVQVVAISHLVGLLGVAVASVFIGPEIRADDMVLGVIGGAFGGLGVGLLYRRLSVGPMHVVAPLTAITSAVVPTAWGVAVGERPTLLIWLGLGLGLLAIGLVSSSSSADSAPIGPLVVIESLLGGCGFGLFFIFLDATDPASAPLPIVTARLVTTIGLTAYLLALRAPVRPPNRITLWLIVATGLLDVGANVGFLYATNRGDLAIVSVLTSLYPIATVLLARAVLSERMTSRQGWGLVGAIGATSLIAAG